MANSGLSHIILACLMLTASHQVFASNVCITALARPSHQLVVKLDNPKDIAYANLPEPLHTKMIGLLDMDLQQRVADTVFSERVYSKYLLLGVPEAEAKRRIREAIQKILRRGREMGLLDLYKQIGGAVTPLIGDGKKNGLEAKFNLDRYYRLLSEADKFRHFHDRDINPVSLRAILGLAMEIQDFESYKEAFLQLMILSPGDYNSLGGSNYGPELTFQAGLIKYTAHKNLIARGHFGVYLKQAIAHFAVVVNDGYGDFTSQANDALEALAEELLEQTYPASREEILTNAIQALSAIRVKNHLPDALKPKLRRLLSEQLNIIRKHKDCLRPDYWKDVGIGLVAVGDLNALRAWTKFLMLRATDSKLTAAANGRFVHPAIEMAKLVGDEKFAARVRKLLKDPEVSRVVYKEEEMAGQRADLNASEKYLYAEELHFRGRVEDESAKLTPESRIQLLREGIAYLDKNEPNWAYPIFFRAGCPQGLVATAELYAKQQNYANAESVLLAAALWQEMRPELAKESSLPKDIALRLQGQLTIENKN